MAKPRRPRAQPLRARQEGKAAGKAAEMPEGRRGGKKARQLRGTTPLLMAKQPLRELRLVRVVRVARVVRAARRRTRQRVRMVLLPKAGRRVGRRLGRAEMGRWLRKGTGTGRVGTCRLRRARWGRGRRAWRRERASSRAWRRVWRRGASRRTGWIALR